MNFLYRLNELRKEFNTRYTETLDDLWERYESFRENCSDKLNKLYLVADSLVVGGFMISSFSDTLITLNNATTPSDEQNSFLVYLMEKYGMVDGLSRHTGYELLMGASILGCGALLKSVIEYVKDTELEMEFKLLVAYPALLSLTYDHIKGIISWLG